MRKLLSIPVFAAVSSRDELTGILNSYGFEKMVQKILHKNPNHTYIAVKFDIDKFRELNGRYSSARGNLLLCEIAQAIDNWQHEKQVFARLDTDRFILLLERTPTVMTELNELLEKTVAQLGIDKYMGAVKFTYGAYEVNGNKEAVTSIMSKVKIAHKMAKKNEKKNIVWYNSGLLQVIQQENYYNDHLFEGIAMKQFMVYLQHQVSLQGNNEESLEAEALVRWALPNGRMMYPDSFIPQFEQNGMIVYLDLYVLESICIYIRALITEGRKNVRIAINVSDTTLMQLDIVDKFVAIVDKYGVSPQCICMEVHEVSFIEGESIAINNLHQFVDKGFIIAMDAFASGYSSLRMLPDLPVSILKLDRKFLRANEKNEKTKIIMDSIITLAHKLNLKVTCEGVEHQKDLDLLQELHCDMAQGYYIAKPVSEEEFMVTIDEVNRGLRDKMKNIN